MLQPVRSHDMECEVELTQFTKKRGKFNHKTKDGEKSDYSDLTHSPFLTQTPTCFPCLLSSPASLVLIVQLNPSPLCSVECEIMCFTKYCGSC